MSRSVIKFGGSDLKTSYDIKRVIDILHTYDRPVVVVLSAFYGITDKLIDALDKAEQGRLDIEKLIDDILQMKQTAIEKHIEDGESAKTALEKIQVLTKELSDYFKAVSYVHDVPRPSRALILSYGERLSALCLSEIFKANRLDAVLSLPEDLKLITDGEYQNATVDFTRSKVKQHLPQNQVVVVPGYYGVSSEGKTTLLGRGGSDYAAAAYAYC